MKSGNTALVTGANRGIGKEIARQLGRNGFHVFVGARSLESAVKTVDEFKKEGIQATPIEIDVSVDQSIKKAAETVRRQTESLDVLVNNAGVFLDDLENSTISSTAKETLLRTFETNTVGPLLMGQAFLPLLLSSKLKRMINLSSGMGQLSEMNGGCASYRISKTGLNAVTKIFAEEFSEQGLQVHSVCPGWVKTDMGGPGAERPVEKGAETPVWLATHPDLGESGGFWRDKSRIEW